MNRQEIIERLKLIQAGLTQDDNNKSKNRIDAVIENLKQPATLTDFLGWEENAIYTDGNIYYKVKDGMLYFKIKKIWNLSGYNDNFNICYKFREYDKAENIKFNLILRNPHRKRFGLQDDEKYFAICIQDGSIFHSKSSKNNSKYQVQFTFKEIEEVERKYNLKLGFYDIEEVKK